MNYLRNITKWIIQIVWFFSIVLIAWLSLAPRIEIPYQFSGADKLAHCLAYAWAGNPSLLWMCEHAGGPHRGVFNGPPRYRA